MTITITVNKIADDVGLHVCTNFTYLTDGLFTAWSAAHIGWPTLEAVWHRERGL